MIFWSLYVIFFLSHSPSHHTSNTVPFFLLYILFPRTFLSTILLLFLSHHDTLCERFKALKLTCWEWTTKKYVCYPLLLMLLFAAVNDYDTKHKNCMYGWRKMLNEHSALENTNIRSFRVCLTPTWHSILLFLIKIQ